MPLSQQFLSSIQRIDSFKNVFKAYLDQDYTSVAQEQEEQIREEQVELITSTKITNHFESILIKNKGKKYSTVKSYSRYDDPIISDEPYRGKSRIHADIEVGKQERVVEDFVKYCFLKPFKRRSDIAGKTGTEENLDDRFISICIAIMRLESGFNIDAAAGTTSAASYGQFVKKTGRFYGIDNENLWDFIPNIKALIDHTLDNKDRADKKKQSEDYIYAYHHDGSTLKTVGPERGIDLSKKHVMPKVDKIELLVSSF